MLRRVFLSLLLAAAPVSIGVRAQILDIQFMGDPGEPDAVPPPPGEDAPQDWEEQAEASVPASHCVKMCPEDYSPCDPIYFKTEDGRCDGVHMR